MAEPRKNSKETIRANERLVGSERKAINYRDRGAKKSIS